MASFVQIKPWGARMANVLDIDPEDSVDLRLDIERSFGIQMTNDEAERCQTVGDLYALVLGYIRHVDKSDVVPCLSSTAFRRLRRALRKHQPETTLAVSTPLALFPKSNRWWADFEAEAGLWLPFREPKTTTVICAAVTLLSPVIFLFLNREIIFVAAAFAAAAGFAILHYGPKKFRSDCRTVGDLARAAAVRNFGALSLRHSAVRKDEIWKALETIIRGYCPNDAKISPETLFFAPK